MISRRAQADRLSDPAAYEAWYHTPRGRWIARRESSLLLNLLQPVRGQTLLDVGCGTGYFSRRFAAAGLAVTAVDPDSDMLDYARRQDAPVNYIQGVAERLSFADECFDHAVAVTSCGHSHA